MRSYGSLHDARSVKAGVIGPGSLQSKCCHFTRSSKQFFVAAQENVNFVKFCYVSQDFSRGTALARELERKSDIYFESENPRFVSGKAVLEVRDDLTLVQLVLPRRFLILLKLHLPALLVHAL